jgi:hydrogenase maturation factor
MLPSSQRAPPVSLIGLQAEKAGDADCSWYCFYSAGERKDQTSFLEDDNGRVGTMLLGKEGGILAVFVELAEMSAQDWKIDECRIEISRHIRVYEGKYWLS